MSFNKQNVLKGAEKAKSELGQPELKFDPTIDVDEHYRDRAKKIKQEQLAYRREMEIIGELRHVQVADYDAQARPQGHRQVHQRPNHNRVVMVCYIGYRLCFNKKLSLFLATSAIIQSSRYLEN